MSESDLKISITTVANTAGADSTIGSMERVEAHARAAGQAVDAARAAAEREGPLTELQKLEFELQKITAEAKVMDSALSKINSAGGTAPGLARQIGQRDTQADMLVAQIEALSNVGQKAEGALKPLREIHDLQPKIGAGGRNMGQAMLQVGYAMQDAQYGMRGVVNNIPSLLMCMGGGAGLAGVATLAAVAISTLGPAFANMFSGDPSERLKKLTEEFAELKKHSAEARKELTKENEKKWYESLQDDTKAFQQLNDEIARNISLEQNRRRNKLEEESSQAALDMAEIDANPNMSEPDKIRARAKIQGGLAKSKAAAALANEKEAAELARTKAGNLTGDHFLSEVDLGEVTQREADAKARAADLRNRKREAEADDRQMKEAEDELLKLRTPQTSAGGVAYNPGNPAREAELEKRLQKRAVTFSSKDQEELDNLTGKGGSIDTLKSEREAAQKAADAKADAAEAARRDAAAAGQRAVDNANTIQRNYARDAARSTLTTNHSATSAQAKDDAAAQAKEDAAEKAKAAAAEKLRNSREKAAGEAHKIAETSGKYASAAGLSQLHDRATAVQDNPGDKKAVEALSTMLSALLDHLEKSGKSNDGKLSELEGRIKTLQRQINNK